MSRQRCVPIRRVLRLGVLRTNIFQSLVVFRSSWMATIREDRIAKLFNCKSDWCFFYTGMRPVEGYFAKLIRRSWTLSQPSNKAA